jgi:DNA-directed RNA polymerase specialized sigma24 family protein
MLLAPSKGGRVNPDSEPRLDEPAEAVDAMLPPPDAPPRRAPLPELASLSRKEFADLYETTWAFARRLARSNDLADELTQTAFELLHTTRRWDPNAKVPLARHLLGIVKSTLSHRRTSKAPEHEAEAVDGFTRERGDTSGSAEDAHVARDDSEDNRVNATRVIDSLRGRLAEHPVALARLGLVAEGIDKPAEQARRLKVSVEEIYRAREVTQYHMNRIRAAKSGDGE